MPRSDELSIKTNLNLNFMKSENHHLYIPKRTILSIYTKEYEYRFQVPGKFHFEEVSLWKKIGESRNNSKVRGGSEGA